MTNKNIITLHTSAADTANTALFFTRRSFMFQPVRSAQIGDAMSSIINQMYIPLAKIVAPEPTVNELEFRALDVAVGDIVSLRPRGGNSDAVLSGEVVQIKTVNGGLESQLRIKGFDETPHHNHNVWFGVEENEVTVDERVYRWTGDDRLIAAIIGREEAWPTWKEDLRETYRKGYTQVVERVKKALAAQS